MGGYYGNFYGYYWSGSAWVSDSSIVNGLTDIGDWSNPSIFLLNNSLNLIAGQYYGAWYGWNTIFESSSSPSTISISIRSQQNSNSLSTFINDIDSTGGFTDNNGYITLTPTIAASYPLDVQADLEDGIKLTIVSADSVPSMPITFAGLDTSEDYKLYLDGTLTTTFAASSPYYYYDIITHSTLSTIEFVKVTGTSGSGGSNGDTPPTPPTSPTTPILDIILIESDIEEELLVLFPEDPILTVTTFLSQPTNWLILLGAYLGVLIGTIFSSSATINIPTILLNGTVTILIILILAALGINLLFLNILFSTPSILLAFLTYTIYGIIISFFSSKII